MIAQQEFAQAERLLRAGLPEHVQAGEPGVEQQLPARDERAQERVAQIGPFAHDAADVARRDAEHLGLAPRLRAHHRAPPCQDVDVAGELAGAVHRDDPLTPGAVLLGPGPIDDLQGAREHDEDTASRVA